MSLSFALGVPVCPVTLIISAYLTFLLYHCFIFNTTIPYLSDLLSKLSFGWFSVSGMGIHLFLFKTSSWLQLFTQKVFIWSPLCISCNEDVSIWRWLSDTCCVILIVSQRYWLSVQVWYFLFWSRIFAFFTSPDTKYVVPHPSRNARASHVKVD